MIQVCDLDARIFLIAECGMRNAEYGPPWCELTGFDNFQRILLK